MKTKTKTTPQRKAVNFLIEKGWEFDDDSEVRKQFKSASKYGYWRGELGDAISYLIKKGWFFNTIADLKTLDKARQIALRSTPKTH